MTESQEALRLQLARQVAHWTVATKALSDLTRIASASAWQALEHYLGAALRATISEAIERLARQMAVLEAQLAAAETQRELRTLQLAIVKARRLYLAVEAILDFYGDAINTRTNPQIAAYLAACDRLATASMRAVLEPLGHDTPHVLTYLEKGAGASVLKAGLKLWDGRSFSRVAAIKLVRHNLMRPTSLLHEAGHQIAHIVSWTEELRDALGRTIGSYDREVGSLWAAWASEVAADAFAFAHAGYASVAALHDVLSADRASVMNVQAFDPHPASYLRVLLGCEMCRTFYGAGPWDSMATAWRQLFPIEGEGFSASNVLRTSVPLLGEVVDVLYRQPYKAFRGKPLASIVDPLRVRPEALLELSRGAGKALFQSSHFIERESLRLLALSGYRAAVHPEKALELAAQQEAWMLRLGSHARAA